MDYLVELPAWALVIGPSGTAILGVVAGYWMRMASTKDLQYIVENVVGDTYYHVAGDYIERPFEDVPPTH